LWIGRLWDSLNWDRCLSNNSIEIRNQDNSLVSLGKV
jgi:hypothetical protein